jgi:hypothetical protein
MPSPWALDHPFRLVAHPILAIQLLALPWAGGPLALTPVPPLLPPCQSQASSTPRLRGQVA